MSLLLCYLPGDDFLDGGLLLFLHKFKGGGACFVGEGAIVLEAGDFLLGGLVYLVNREDLFGRRVIVFRTLLGLFEQWILSELIERKTLRADRLANGFVTLALKFGA